MGILGSPNGSRASRPATRKSLTLAMSEVIPVLNNHADSLQALDRAAGGIAGRVTVLETAYKADSAFTLDALAQLTQRVEALETILKAQVQRDAERPWWQRVLRNA